MFYLAFVQGYNVPFRKQVYLTKNLLLKSNGRASLRPPPAPRFSFNTGIRRHYTL